MWWEGDGHTCTSVQIKTPMNSNSRDWGNWNDWNPITSFPPPDAPVRCITRIEFVTPWKTQIGDEVRPVFIKWGYLKSTESDFILIVQKSEIYLFCWTNAGSKAWTLLRNRLTIGVCFPVVYLIYINVRKYFREYLIESIGILKKYIWSGYYRMLTIKPSLYPLKHDELK